MPTVPDVLDDMERDPAGRARNILDHPWGLAACYLAVAVIFVTLVISVLYGGSGVTRSSLSVPAPAMALPPPDEALPLKTMLADPAAPHGQEFPVKVTSIAMAKPITLLIADESGNWLKPLLSLMFYVEPDGGSARFAGKKGQSINCKIDSAGKDFICWFP